MIGKKKEKGTRRSGWVTGTEEIKDLVLHRKANKLLINNLLLMTHLASTTMLKIMKTGIRRGFLGPRV